jgi:hypothetical protein
VAGATLANHLVAEVRMVAEAEGVEETAKWAEGVKVPVAEAANCPQQFRSGHHSRSGHS